MKNGTIDEIERLANSMAANIHMKMDYKSFLNHQRKLLIVEGPTDKLFIEKIKDSTVECFEAMKIFKSNDAFRFNRSEKINCKNSIVRLIQGISNFPSPFIKYPKDMDKWDIFGMVDLDCEDIPVGKPLNKLFVTDAHDLETTIISTDEDVFFRLDSCCISSDDIKKSYFLAYQISECRKILTDYYDEEHFEVNLISCGSYEVEFSSFIKDNRVNISDMIKYISDNSNSPLTTFKIKQMLQEILKSKMGKKRFSQEGLWKQSFETFDINNVSDFWIRVNGHDILQLIRYHNESAYIAFQNNSNKLNRNFEMAIINNYNYETFASTEMASKMLNKEVIVLY